MPLSREQKIDFLAATVIFLFAMALRFAYLWQIYTVPFFFHPVIDARMYDLWGQNIARGVWLWKEIPFQAPGYAYFLAFIYLIFDFNYTAPMFLQAAFGSLTCVFVFLIVRRLLAHVGFVAAFIAGLCAACYWPLIYHDGQLISECLALFLGFAGLWAIVKARDTAEEKELGTRNAEARSQKLETPKLTLSYWLLGGLLLGLSAATRPNILPFLPFVALWALGIPRQKPREMARQMRLWSYRLVAAFLLLIGLICPLGLITWRNYHNSGAFFPIQWNTAVNFYIGNNSQATGMPSIQEGNSYNRLRNWPAAEGHKGQIKEARFFMDKSLEFVRESPGDWLKLILKKFVLFWNAFEIADIQDIYYHRFWSSLLSLPWPGLEVVGPLGLAGLILLLPQWRRLFLLYALLVSNLLGVMLFTVSARYRLMAIPVLICFASVTLIALGRWAGQRAWGRLVAAALLLAGGSFFVNHDFYSVRATRIFRRHYHIGMVCVEVSRSETSAEEQGKRLILAAEAFKKELEFSPGDVDVLYALGTTYLALSVYNPAYFDQAYTSLKEAMDNQPDHTDLYVAMGNLYEKMRRLPHAEGEYEEAMRLNPECFEAYNNMGHVLNLRGKHEEAMPYLEKARELRPASPDPLNNLGIALAGLKRYGEAIVMYQRAVERDPGSASLHYNLACAYFSEGRPIEAEVEAEIARTLGHPRADALLRKLSSSPK
jgi:Tfp pilus assembly protein PilF